MTTSARVVLADDHRLVRAGIRALLERLPELQVVAEAGDGREALAMVRLHKPDLVLIDTSMPGMDGIGATARIVKEYPRTRVLVLSADAIEEHVVQALRMGARGYLLKDGAPAELEIAVKAVLGGSTYLSPAVSRHVIDGYIRREAEPSAREHLTLRQREILQLIAEGRSSKQIAGTLNLSVKTIETHRAHLMERLDIHDVAGLVRYAIRVGIVSAEQ